MTRPSRSSFALAAAVCIAAASACPTQVAVTDCADAPDSPGCAPPANNDPPRFFADPPFGVGFECVTIGCDTEKPLRLENRGGGKLGIALVRPSVDTSSDMTVRRADGEPLPLGDDEGETHVVLGAGEKLELTVRYVPSDGVLDEGAVLVEHYDAATPYLDSTPSEDEIPLNSRALGTPAVTVPVEVLDFGFVPVGTSVELELTVQNAANDSVLTVGPLDREEGTAPVFHPRSAREWGERFANPGVDASYTVVFTPAAATAYFGALTLATNDPLRPVVRVVVQGTAIADARAAVIEPVGALALAPVRAGETRTGVVKVQNIGGAPLSVSGSIVAASDPGLVVTSAPVDALAPLAVTDVVVSLTSSVGGLVNGTLLLATNDATLPSGMTGVSVTGAVEAPVLTATPGFMDLGDVVQGWTAAPQQLAIANTGFGELTITAISFEVGSTSQIQIVDVPPLPVKLSPDEAPLVLTVVMTAQTLGPADAVALIASDAVDNAIARVNLHGDVITCNEGCPTPNGTPRCDSGFCEVGTCFDDFHDADTVVGNGCECTEDIIGNVREDIGQACPGVDLGNLSDDNSGFTRSGTLHDSDDIDLWFIRMKDDTQFLDDEYGGEVVLVSGPPGMLICANFRQEGSGCGGLPTNCSTTKVRGNGQSGVFGSSNNSEDVTVFVMWQAGAAPQCGNYTVRFDADEDF